MSFARCVEITSGISANFQEDQTHFIHEIYPLNKNSTQSLFKLCNIDTSKLSAIL